MFGLLAFVTVSMFGLSHHMSGMTEDENGDMAGCVFTGKTMLCKMSVIEHISLWQSMFTAMPQESFMLFALLILLVVVIFVIKNILVRARLSGSGAFINKLSLKKNPDLTLFNPLKEAFSQGILNPKIYDLAVL